MKKLFCFIVLLFCAAGIKAQSLTGQLTAQGTTCGVSSTSSLVLSRNAGGVINSAAFTLSGTWSGTATFYASADGGASYTAFAVVPSGGGAAVTTSTGNGLWNQATASDTNFCVVATTWVSGTFVVTIRLSTDAPPAGGGGGSGTVTSLTSTSPVIVTPSPTTTTGVISCTTCATTTNGGALSGTSPVTISVAGAIGCATCGVTGSPLSQFASTTSAQLAGVLSDGTGTGANVFANTPTLVTPNIGAATGTGVTLGTDNSVAGSVQLANSAANAHTIIGSGATTTNTIKGFTVAPTTTDLVSCTTASTTCTLTDTGVASTNVVQLVLSTTQTLQPSAAVDGLILKANAGGGSPLRVQTSGAGAVLTVTPGAGVATNAAGGLGVDLLYNGVSGNVLFSRVAPTIGAAGCGGSGASIPNSNGTVAFQVNVGTSNTGTCTVTMPGAHTNWVCSATDITNTSTAVSQTKAKPGGTPATQITLQNYTDISGTGAWTDSDVIAISCWAE